MHGVYSKSKSQPPTGATWALELLLLKQSIVFLVQFLKFPMILFLQDWGPNPFLDTRFQPHAFLILHDPTSHPGSLGESQQAVGNGAHGRDKHSQNTHRENASFNCSAETAK
jgi:hypothetical protein